MININEILNYLTIAGGIMAMSIAASVLSKKDGFSTDVFLVSVAIGFAIMVWIEVLPSYTIIFSVFILAGMLYASRSGGFNE